MRCVAKTECWGAKLYRPRAHSHSHSPLSPYYCRRYLVPWKTFTWDFVHSGQIFFPLSYNCLHRRGKDGLDAREVAWRNQCSKLVSTGSTCSMFTIAALRVISDATEGRARKFKPRLEERFSQDTCPTIILLFFHFFRVPSMGCYIRALTRYWSFVDQRQQNSACARARKRQKPRQRLAFTGGWILCFDLT